MAEGRGSREQTGDPHVAKRRGGDARSRRAAGWTFLLASTDEGDRPTGSRCAGDRPDPGTRGMRSKATAVARHERVRSGLKSGLDRTDVLLRKAEWRAMGPQPRRHRARIPATIFADLQGSELETRAARGRRTD